MIFTELSRKYSAKLNKRKYYQGPNECLFQSLSEKNKHTFSVILIYLTFYEYLWHNYDIGHKKEHVFCLRTIYIYERLTCGIIFLAQGRIHSFCLLIVILFISDSYNMWSYCMNLTVICHYQGELNYFLAVFLVHIHNARYTKHFLIF